jgi:hypothetical protein
MRQPGRVQIALKESPSHVLPAAVIYDYPINEGTVRQAQLCPEFLSAYSNGLPLIETRCFHNDCPTRDSLAYVCPSGFWGFRHVIGLPHSLATHPGDVETKISYQGTPEAIYAVARDLGLREEHYKNLAALAPKFHWTSCDEHEGTIKTLKTKTPHLVYFYCHGHVDDDAPCIFVGEQNAPGIYRSSLRAEGINWGNSRPLIFLNGCHTSALSPEQAINLVSGFIENASASGVIGTEISVFESLASQFAEACLAVFVQGKSIGDAIRNARLTLLQQGNPLGLVYVPFVIDTLRLVDKSSEGGESVEAQVEGNVA